ncbi:MAG: PAS domain S-box protein [bacterium]
MKREIPWKTRWRGNPIFGKNQIFSRLPLLFAVVLISAGLYLTASLFQGFHSLSAVAGFPSHILVEIFGMIVASGIFMFAWSSRRFQDNNYFLFVGIAYLFVAGMDLVHTLVYQSVVFRGISLNLAVQFRVAARYIESVSLLIAPLFIGRKLKNRLVFLGYFLTASLLVVAIFPGRIFPACFIDGAGLTLFNTISEAGICCALLASIALLSRKRTSFDPDGLQLLIASIVLTIGSELTFTFSGYAALSFNLAGHSLEAASYYLIYKAIVETGLMRPYAVLFRNLKQSEESAKATSAELDQIFNTAADAMWMIDKDFNILKINRTFLNLLGLRRDEVIGKKCYDIFPSSECHTSHCPLARIFGGEERVEFDAEKLRRDGLIIPSIVTATPFRRPDGEVIGMVEDFGDITERKRMEDRLREERDRAQQYLDVVGVMIVVIDADQKVSLINKKGCKILGYAEEDILGRNWFDTFIPERMRGEVLAVFEKIKSGKIEPVEYFENPVLTRSGEERIISWHNTVLRDEAGKIIAVLSSGEDITDRKLAEAELEKYRFHLEELVRERTAELSGTTIELSNALEQLRESEMKYSTLVEEAKDGVAVIQDGVFQFANEAMADISGYTVEELIGKPALEIIAEYRRDKCCCLASEKTVSSCGTNIYGKDGVNKDVDISIGLIQYQGRPATIAIIRDITERKRMEEELIRVQKLESLGVLAGGIAHDFNNLLTAVIGNLSLLEKRLKPDEIRMFEILEAARNASLKGKHLTHQLLTFSKGGVPIKKTMPVSELIRDTVGFALSGSNVEYKLSLPEDLWWAEIDEGQITQVLNNLIINADQAMPKGGIISIEAENVLVQAQSGLPLQEGRYIRISVKDQGVGIPEHYLHRVFDPFFTTKAEGNGLGLAITYSIVKKHGGHITVTSRPGAGTTFSVYLPASEKELFAVQHVVEKELLSPPRQEGGRILFMDDQSSIREMVGDMLADLGYDVALAREGSEAVALYEQAKVSGHPFDAVILDLTIPGGMGGDEAIRELRSIDPEIKAIVSSGYSNDPIMSEYQEHGFQGVVAKPYDIGEMGKVLHRVLKG